MLLTDKIFTFEQILFDLLLGIYKCIEIEFSTIKDRVKFYLMLQDKGYDNQLEIYISSLTSIVLYTHESEYWLRLEKVSYTKVGDNEFKKL